jgi:hypothetical protein
MAATLLDRYEPSQPALDGIVEDGTPNPVLCHPSRAAPSLRTRRWMASSEMEAPLRSSRSRTVAPFSFYSAIERALRASLFTWSRTQSQPKKSRFWQSDPKKSYAIEL